LYYSSIYA